jgi:subtilisin family serine protease
MGFLSKDIRMAKHSRIALSLEPLEPRVMLSADSSLDVASLVVCPAWTECVNGFDSSNSEILGEYGTRTVQTRDATFDVVQDHWIVQFTQEAVDGISGVADTASLLTSDIDFQVLRGLGMVGVVLLRTDGADPDAVESWLSANPNVASYGYDTVSQMDATYPDDPYLNSALWAFNNTGQTGGTPDADIDAVQAWDTTTGSASIVVGVIDSGVDYTHPDLAANMWVNTVEQGGLPGVDDDLNGYVDDIYGYDFINGDSDPMDDYGHGTHVAGTIGAVGNNSIGVVGVNWTTSIMALKVFDSTGATTTAALIEAINYATMMRQEYDDGSADGNPGADLRVTNNSWGGYAPDAGLEAAIAANGAAGCLFVAAAGNDSLNTDIFGHYPSSYDLDNIISVAASDDHDQLASFSNYGAETVDLAAPGHAIFSTYMGGIYSYSSGTSRAAPMVTGVAALAWAANPAATMEQVRDAILAGAEPRVSLIGKVATGGRLNAGATLERVMYADPVNIQVAAFVSGAANVTVYDVQGYVNVEPLLVNVTFEPGNQVKEITFGSDTSQDGVGIVITGASYVGSIKDQGGSDGSIAYIVSDTGIGSIKLKSSITGANINGAVLDGLALPADIDGDGNTADFTGLYVDGYVGKMDVPGDVMADLYFGSLGRLKVKGSAFTDIVVNGASGQISLGGDAMGSIGIGGPSSKIDIRGNVWDAINIDSSSGSVRIRGSMMGLLFSGQNSTINVGGSASDIRVNGGIQVGSYITVDGWLGRFDSGMISGFDVSTEAAIPLNAVQLLTTGSIGKVNIKGGATGFRMLAGTDLGDDLMVGGVGLDADFYAPASIGSVKISDGKTTQPEIFVTLMGPVVVERTTVSQGNLISSLIGNSVIPVFGNLDLSLAAFYGSFLYGSIGKLDVSGQLSGPGVGAYTFGSIKVAGVSYIRNHFLIGPGLPVYYTVI